MASWRNKSGAESLQNEAGTSWITKKQSKISMVMSKGHRASYWPKMGQLDL